MLNEIVKAVQGLCHHLNLTEAEVAEYTQKVKERNIGYLWVNAERTDIQTESRMWAEAEKKVKEKIAKKEETNLRTLKALVEFGKQMRAAG